MEEEDKHKAAKNIHEKARYFRGKFLNKVAVIDREIALILTNYFCTDQDKKEFFFENIATAPFLTFNSKRELLIQIVKRDYQFYWGEYGSTLKDLTEIMKFRNKLAHSIVDVSEDALRRPLNNGIGFIEWKAGEPITDEQFDEWEIKATMVLDCIYDIKRLLKFLG
jgi:hypothetical protein